MQYFNPKVKFNSFFKQKFYDQFNTRYVSFESIYCTNYIEHDTQ